MSKTTYKLEKFRKSKQNSEWQEHWRELHNLLQPITWNWSSSIESRKRLVNRRRDDVLLVRPFLTGSALDLCDQWLEEERHRGLWD